jgi:hypothetical protein
MELTWVAIASSLLMGLGAACLFIYAVKKDYFRNIEDAKYQVFWSDLEELVDSAEVKKHDGNAAKNPSRSLDL